jgi:adenylyltransferase/sulfurtransferase
LINDYAAEKSVPWIYAAVVSSYGLVMPIYPGETPCLACIVEETGSERDGPTPLPNEPTCDTVGVIGPAAAAIASLEAAAAMKILAGKFEPRESRLIALDVWTGRCQSLQMQRRADCRVCGERRFSYLEGEAQPHVTMCGRDSVQIHERRRQLDLGSLGRKLTSGGAQVQQNSFLLRFQVAAYELTVFADGRAIIKGTRDASVARSIYARYVGA